jgi:hypothetical protein
MSLTRWALAAALCLAGTAAPPPHPVRERLLRTWDTWICDYDAPGRSYLQEYKDLVDWMARHEYTGLVIWGFVDGRHGGEASAKELARYARTKGIQLIPGVSTDIGADAAYGGFARGIKDHPYNDEVQARAMEATRRPGEQNICYARAENREWLRRGTEWMLDTFDVDGVHLEVAEGGIRCGCADCAQRDRLQGGLTGGAGLSDLGLRVPIVAEVFRRKRPDGLLTYAVSGPPWWKQKPEALEVLKSIPETAAAQWSFELELRESAGSPVKRNLALLQGGGSAYHLRRREPPAWAFTQYRCFYPKLADIRRFCGHVRTMKLDGFVVGNVGSPKCPDNELACLAFIDFSRDPQMSLEAFYRQRLPELYGDQAAGDVRKLYEAQRAIHEKALPFWIHYDGSWKAEGAKEAARGMADQLALARAASAKASADGKRRLDAIIPILDEYRIICEAAELGTPETRGKLAEFFEKAGLPDDLYPYRTWLK